MDNGLSPTILFVWCYRSWRHAMRVDFVFHVRFGSESFRREILHAMPASPEETFCFRCMLPCLPLLFQFQILCLHLF